MYTRKPSVFWAVTVLTHVKLGAWWQSVDSFNIFMAEYFQIAWPWDMILGTIHLKLEDVAIRVSQDIIVDPDFLCQSFPLRGFFHMNTWGVP